MKIVKAEVKDASDVARLSLQLWPEHDIEEMELEFRELIQMDDAAVFLAREGEAVGFAQCQLRRDYVEGTQSSPVGYLEGIFVTQPCRNRGYARALLAACQDWARARGCTEFASDCELTNSESLAFHLRMGFLEANRIICFTKRL